MRHHPGSGLAPHKAYSYFGLPFKWLSVLINRKCLAPSWLLQVPCCRIELLAELFALLGGTCQQLCCTLRGSGRRPILKSTVTFACLPPQQAALCPCGTRQKQSEARLRTHMPCNQTVVARQQRGAAPSPYALQLRPAKLA